MVIEFLKRALGLNELPKNTVEQVFTDVTLNPLLEPLSIAVFSAVLEASSEVSKTLFGRGRGMSKTEIIEHAESLE